MEKALDEELPPGTQETTKANFNRYKKLVMTKTSVEERDMTFLLELSDRTRFEMRILKKKLLEDVVYSFILHSAPRIKCTYAPRSQ